MAAALMRALCALCVLGSAFAATSLQPTVVERDNSALLSVREQLRVVYRRGTSKAPAWIMTEEERQAQADDRFSPKEEELEPVQAEFAEMPEKLVVIGDIHGDMKALKLALDAAGLIDKWGNWNVDTGGTAWLVQTGDLVDARRVRGRPVKGAFERDIVHWLHTLRAQAEEAGGKVILLQGNHEQYNMFTEGGLWDFKDFVSIDNVMDFHPDPSPLRQKTHYKHGDPKAQRDTTTMRETITDFANPRTQAMQPGNWMAKLLSSHLPFVKIGRFAFMHGGLSQWFVDEALKVFPQEHVAWNQIAGIYRDYLWNGQENAQSQAVVPMLLGAKSTTFFRDLGEPQVFQKDCDAFTELQARPGLDVDRIVIGHTIQTDGINSACGGRVWRVDVGMSAAFADFQAEIHGQAFLEMDKGDTEDEDTEEEDTEDVDEEDVDEEEDTEVVENTADVQVEHNPKSEAVESGDHGDESEIEEVDSEDQQQLTGDAVDNGQVQGLSEEEARLKQEAIARDQNRDLSEKDDGIQNARCTRNLPAALIIQRNGADFEFTRVCAERASNTYRYGQVFPQSRLTNLWDRLKKRN